MKPQPELESVGKCELSSRPHSIEWNVRRALLSECGLDFASLVVRRIPNGVCLEGVLNCLATDDELASAARSVEGVVDVQNHLLVSSASF